MTQGWFKHRPTKAFRMSANVSVLPHNVPNSRGIGWTWNMLKYACTCSTVRCSSHYVPRRIMTYITVTTLSSWELHKLHLNGFSTNPSAQDVAWPHSHFAMTLYGSTYRCTCCCPAPCELMGLIRGGNQSGCTQTWSTSPARPCRTLPTDPLGATCATYMLHQCRTQSLVSALVPDFIFTVFLPLAIIERERERETDRIDRCIDGGIFHRLILLWSIFSQYWQLSQ